MDIFLLKKLQELSSNNKVLYNKLLAIDVSTFKPIKKVSGGKDVAHFYRILNLFKSTLIKESDFGKKKEYDSFQGDIEVIPEDILGALRTIGFIKIAGEWFTPYESTLYRQRIVEEFHHMGFVHNPLEVQLGKSIGRWGEFEFKSMKSVIHFMLIKTSVNFIKIDDETMGIIRDTMSFEVSNLTSLSSSLERYDKLRKIGSFTFKARRDNEKEVARDLYLAIKKIRFNFLNKEQLFTVVKAVIDKYELQEEEPYYILRDYYGGNGIYFSTGNQMSISLNEELISMKSEERMFKILKVPTFLTKMELGLKLGLNEFALQNQKTVRAAGEEFLYCDDNNPNHIEYLKQLFEKFAPIKKKTSFTLKEFRFFCEVSENEFLERLATHKNIPFLLKIVFESELQEFGSYPTKYIIEKDVSNIQFIDADNWEDF